MKKDYIGIVLIFISLLGTLLLPNCYPASDVKAFSPAEKCGHLFPIESQYDLKAAMRCYSDHGYFLDDLFMAVKILRETFKKSKNFAVALDKALDNEEPDELCPDIIIKLLLFFYCSKYVSGFGFEATSQVFITKWFSEGQTTSLRDFWVGSKPDSSGNEVQFLSTIQQVSKQGGGCLPSRDFLGEQYTCNKKLVIKKPSCCCVIL